MCEASPETLLDPEGVKDSGVGGERYGEEMGWVKAQGREKMFVTEKYQAGELEEWRGRQAGE